LANGTDIQTAALSLYQLLGAPLYALIEAETYAAEATADFIERVGFESAAGGTQGDGSARNLGRLRTLSFQQERRDTRGRAASYKVEVPLLSILPIPALQIREAELEFFVKIVDMVQQGQRRRSSNRETAPDAEPNQPADPAGRSPITESGRVDFKTMMGRGQTGGERPSRSGLDMQVHVKIKVAQADTPAGLSRLFNLMEQSISSTPLPDEKEETP
jgi:hypothetical protein